MAEVITRPEVTAVQLTPNPVATGLRYNIAVTVREVEYVPVVSSMFEFPFSNESLNENLLEMGDISYEKRT